MENLRDRRGAMIEILVEDLSHKTRTCRWTKRSLAAACGGLAMLPRAPGGRNPSATDHALDGTNAGRRDLASVLTRPSRRGEATPGRRGARGNNERYEQVQASLSGPRGLDCRYEKNKKSKHERRRTP